ncbi:MAG: hypothetical protein DYG94_12430 [Leptolyngbya sp. PLA3]|nr:MAG: hypothetical protein EDM82_12715 [Cyanobacteria bacterium CYA]MCE7969532.1 hypothetical protein [Leptolyngbya sp. PL-A3]
MAEKEKQAEVRSEETSAIDGPWVASSSSDSTPTAGGGEPSALETFVSSPWGGRFGLLREGDRVPGYRIIRQLGSGGMGAVYLAEQERPTRTVALKVIRSDRVTKATLRRFEYEVQILARLRHPGIAQVYEAGSFDLGDGPMPFFAMEYIADAKTVTAYARGNNLDIRARLQLFACVCDAVHHGHQKGIIHRDLKPGNILVDNTGAPRIIDFGVARASDKENVLATMQTNAGQIVGTLQYMSPEQCSGSSDNVDVRTDVYALGVVLYELLSGELPYDLSTLGLAEALMVVTQDRAPSLSTAHAQFRGDLGVISSKALAKERDERYQSAAELAADIRRYLEDRPILARPIGPVGLLRKWVKRNKEVSLAIALGAAVLAITSAVLIAQIIVAEREASDNWQLAEERLKQANENLAAARSTVDLMGGLFQFRGPDGQSRLDGGKVDVQTLLDDSAEKLRESPPARAATEADWREILGVGYVSLRAVEKAREQLTRVLEIREADKRPRDEDIARASHNLAATYYWDGDYEAAMPLYERAVELRRKLFPGDHPDKALSLTHLAATEQKLGYLDRAEELFTEALTMRQRLFGDQHEDVAASLNNLGNLLVSRGNYAKAEEYLRRSLSMVLRLRGENSVEASTATHNLAMCLMRLEEHAEAASLFERAVAIRSSRYPPGHPAIATSRLGEAQAFIGLNRLEEAETLARSAVDDLRASLRPDHPDVGWSLEVLGRVLMAQARFAEAAPYLAEAVSVTRNVDPPDRELSDRLTLWARCLVETAQYEQAEEILTESMALARNLNNNALHDRASVVLQELYERTGRDDEARRLSAQREGN